MVSTECAEAWITWFSGLVNIPTVAFVTSFDLFVEIPPLQTVWVWTSWARPELRRVEFWGSMYHVHHAQDGLVTTTWPFALSQAQFAMAWALDHA